MILFVAGVVAVAVGLLATRAWRYHVECDQERQEAERQARVERYGDEFRPLLERARAIMDGTADPPPSKERDGELCDWAFARRREYYPDVVRFDISPI